MSSAITDNVRSAQERLRALRPDGGVRIMAVTKNRTRAEALAAVAAGITLLGENRVQEAREKWAGDCPVELHLIGHLQTNKVKYAIDLFNAIQSVDSERVAQALDRRLNRPFPIMVEVNAGQEPTKTGMDPSDLLPFVEQAGQWPNLQLVGLLVLLPQSADQSRRELQRIRKLMQEMVKLWRMCRMEGYPWAPLPDLSMGMSGDWQWAVEAGATLVRLGTAIFGPRGSAEQSE
ncbi:MAG: YggS family pyridoxal phosphate-dependent enzyme [Thermaerobacter sp.]|nr:YggS family pyridoxal phosphate-dependent enzyme [Thermaerobacter sp.]